MIAQRCAVAVFLDSAVDAGARLFTTPMANTDPDTEATSVVADIEGWMSSERGSGGRHTEPGHIRYSVLALLVAFYLLIRQKQKVSLSGAMHVLLYELTPAQRERLGMTGDLTGTRAEAIVRAQDDDADVAQQLAGREAHNREYARLAKFAGAMFTAFDPSPFHKADTLTRSERAAAKKSRAASARSASGRAAAPRRAPDTGRRTRTKMTNALRKAILADPHHPDRRIDAATSARNHERLQDIANKVVAVAAATAPRDNWAGDLAADETIAITLPWRYAHGTKDHLLTSADPDAYYWPGKDNKPKNKAGAGTTKDSDAKTSGGKSNDTDDGSDQIGFGYGITFIVRMGRPYERRIPEIALGIHIGKPTGGTTDAVAQAHERAQRHRLLHTSRHKRFIADQAYTKLDDWLPFLHDHGYRSILDYASHWHIDVALPDTDAHGAPAAGPRLISGHIRCPGATGLSSDLIVRPRPDNAGPESDDDIIARHQRVRLLDTLSMPVKEGLRPDKSACKGRPKKGKAPDTWAITVQCPAALGLVNCPLVERADGLRDPNLPDVPHPPQVADPGLLPRACRQDHVTYHLPLTHAKRIQPFTWGSHQWSDAYESIRSANERYHSQFKHRNSGGVTESWLEMRGIAKAGLLFAIATAVTTDHLIADFRTKHRQADGKATFGPREEARRYRQKVIRDNP